MLNSSRHILIERLRIRASHPHTYSRESPNLISGIALACVIGGIILGMTGCGFKPDPCVPPDPDCTVEPPKEYPPRDTPKRAVEFLRVAWERRDSTKADTVYTDDYQGSSIDQTDPSPSALSFAKSDEVRAIGGLQLDSKITAVRMDFKDSTAWRTESFPSDPPDWVVVTVSKPEIGVQRSDANDLKVTGSQEFQFKTKPVTVAGQTLWQIIHWEEVHNAP